MQTQPRRWALIKKEHQEKNIAFHIKNRQNLIRTVNAQPTPNNESIIS